MKESTYKKLMKIIEKLSLEENPKLHGYLNLKFQYFDFSTKIK